MTRWNDFVSEFAEKKKIAYGCAIVRNDLRKAYNKKFDPVPRNRGIYGTGKMRKMRRPPTEAEAKASALKRTASFKRNADAKAKAVEYQAELAERRQKEAEEKKEARKEAKRPQVEQTPEEARLLKEQLDIMRGADIMKPPKVDPRAEQERRYREDPSQANYLRLDRVQEMIAKNKERWTTIDDAKDIGSERRVKELKELDRIYRKNNREYGVTGLYLYVEKEWKDGKKLLTFNGIDLDMEKGLDGRNKLGYLKLYPGGATDLFVTNKEDRTYKQYRKEREEEE
jgi:hypothetical protein